MGFTPFLTSPPNQVGFSVPSQEPPGHIYYQYCKFYISDHPKPTKTTQITKNKSPKPTKITKVRRAYFDESEIMNKNVKIVAFFYFFH